MKKKNHVPQRGIELTTLQIFQKQGKLDLNTITTWPRSPLFMNAPKLENWSIFNYISLNKGSKIHF